MHFNKRIGIGTYPSTAQSMQIRTTDTTMRDLDIDIGFLPLFRLELLPNHVALGGARVKTHPALKLVIGGHDVYFVAKIDVFCLELCRAESIL